MFIHAKGFTLIEVLISLAILSIALTAIIKTTGLSIRETSYIQQKTLSTWVAKEIIAETKVGLLKLPVSPALSEGDKMLMNQKWHWQASLKKTPNPNIQSIEVTVLFHSKQIQSMTGYLYVA